MHSQGPNYEPCSLAKGTGEQQAAISKGWALSRRITQMASFAFLKNHRGCPAGETTIEKKTRRRVAR